MDLNAYLERLLEAMAYWRKEKNAAAEKYRELHNLSQQLAQSPRPEWLDRQMTTSLNYETECESCLTYLEHTYSSAKSGSS